MKVCDVVLNSIWYDPRVRKQIAEYVKHPDIELSCVGWKCNKYDPEKIAEIPCKVVLADIDERLKGKQNNIFRKLLREHATNIAVRDAIIAEKPDIIHANDLNALIPAYMAAKKLKCKIIYDSHEIWVENFFLKKLNIYAQMLKAKERRIVKKIDKMICVSHAAADYFASEYKIEKPMVITNCSLISEQVCSDEKTTGFEVLNHGQFYKGRGYDIMLECAPDLLRGYSDIKLAIRGYGAMEEELRARKQELGCDNFIFYPPVHVKELIPSASHSHVGVAITEAICLNFKLSVSNKLFEYASAGLPVIMSDIPEHRYLNDKYQFGIIISENTPQALFEAVVKLYEDKEFYQRCKEGALKLSEEVNWETEFGRLIEFEKEITSK